MIWDVIVVGAGPAGLLAATRAAERGRKTLLLEKNNKVGVKILISGGARCNITQETDRRGIVNAFGRNGPFLHSALAALGPEELVALINAEGVPTKIEQTGKIFPVSDKASDVAHALERRLRRSGCKVSLEEPVLRFGFDEGGLKVETPGASYSTEKLIITTGGQSFPGSGTTGDGYVWARETGHSVANPTPALVPLTTDESWVKELTGITVPDVHLKVSETSETPKFSGRKRPPSERGSVLFTHFGLSGPAVLNISRWVTGHANPGSLFLVCDFVPDKMQQELDDLLQRALREEGKKQVSGILAIFVPRRLAESLLARAGIAPDQKGGNLSRPQRLSVLSNLKALPVAISGSLGFRKAEVTAGGVSLKEVDSRDMQSKLVPGLYFAGEILDLDGLIGGYNFQSAFATGWLAGECV
ncbi:MAG: NAD(P)/FAD-dependent oxidoreductase [Planctomycetota bacterium]|nr:NAD(P)/FAD-dependent oxidoreductase [Planctomycetota bacterium]